MLAQNIRRADPEREKPIRIGSPVLAFCRTLIKTPEHRMLL